MHAGGGGGGWELRYHIIIAVYHCLGTGHDLAGGVGRWKQWGVTYFLARKKGGS